MKPIILYRDDADWKQEEKFAKKYFDCTNSRMKIPPATLVIARFSALPFYKEQENDMIFNHSKMINSYNQHVYISDLGNWYYDLAEFTPKTWSNLHEIPEDGPFVLKGETNSKKYHWNKMMFAKDKAAAIEVHSRLTEDSMLQYQKIYIRKYIPLEKLQDGLQGLPITREYRFFVYKDRILSGGFYWSSHTYELRERGLNLSEQEVPVEFLNKIIAKVRNTEICEPPDYYVIDVAKTESGDWILIELNDGQMSGLSENNPDTLYRTLRDAISDDVNHGNI